MRGMAGHLRVTKKILTLASSDWVDNESASKRNCRGKARKPHGPTLELSRGGSANVDCRESRINLLISAWVTSDDFIS